MKKISLLLFILLFFSSCSKQVEKKIISENPPVVELTKVSYNELEGWKQDNLDDFIPVLTGICNKIKYLQSPIIDQSYITIKTKDYQKICLEFNKQKITDSSDLRLFLEKYFTPWLIQYNGNAEGTFTSYYETQIHASQHKHGKYIYPVYGKPSDLIEVNLRDFDPNLPQKRIVGKIYKQKLQPYPTRQEIETSLNKAPVLLWADDPVDIHIMQIQGSAVALLDDGRQIRIGYADNNGRPFKGIGRILLEKKLIPPEKADMINIKKWLKEHPDQAKSLMWENQRYIFHRIIEGQGPIGAYGLPLTAGRSLAVDRQYIPLGALLWLETKTPDQQPLHKIVAAQDIGSAIKGVVRGDYFWGSGGDDVLALAGKMNSIGHYFILLPKETINE